MKPSLHFSRMKQDHLEKEQWTTENNCQSFKVTSAEEVLKNSLKDQTICYETKDSTLTNEEERGDTQNHQLTLSEEKDELTEKHKKGSQ